MKKAFFLDGLLAATALFALVSVASSLSWPVVRDLPVMLYEGFLVHDLGLVPYRDFFEMNAPGTLLLSSSLHQATGGGQLALRLADLLILAGIGAFTCLALGRHGARAGILASAMFTALYLSTGPGSSLQREYLCLLPLAVSLGLIFRRHDIAGAKLYPLFLAGAMGGLAFTIKPPMILCWLPLLAYDAYLAVSLEDEGAALRRRLPRWAKPGLVALAGLLAPILLTVAWLVYHQALQPFLEMVANYYPLYTQIDGSGVVLPSNGAEFFARYFLRTLPLFAGPAALLAMLGTYAGWSVEDRSVRAQNAALAGLALLATLYVPISGKFWLYHKLPLFYAFSLCGAIALSRGLPLPFRSSWPRTLTFALALLASLPFEQFVVQLRLWQGPKALETRGPQLDQMATYLREHSTPADTILPLDTTAGAIHALYQERRPLYGRFIYDFHFYHHAGNPYIEHLRRQFLAQFADGKPTLVLKCDPLWRPRDRVDRGFPELDAILRDQYAVELQSNGCAVLRRR